MYVHLSTVKAPRDAAYDATLAEGWAGVYRSSGKKTTIYVYIYEVRKGF